MAATLSDGTSYAYGYDDRLLNTNENVTVGGESFSVNRTHDQFRRALETVVIVTNVRHAAKVCLYDSEDRVCGYALTNAAGRGVSVALAYDGSHVTNMAYTLPNGGVLAVNLTRERARKELVTRRGYHFGNRPVYWYETGYDLLGRPTNATDSVSLAREWLYNRRSELAAATIGTSRYGYAYDTIGNRLWSAANAVTNSYTANRLSQYTAISANANPVYDADGNMTGDGRFSYAYDAENRLVSVTSAMETNGALRVLNAYDHRSRRIRKIVQRLSVGVAPPPSPPAETRKWETVETHAFVWDGMNIVLEQVAFADGTARTFEYFWGMDKSGTEQGTGGVGGLLAVSVDGVFHVPCYDHNGNIVRYVSETGTVATQYVYDPYGNVVESSGPLADVFTFGFSTKCRERETGLVAYQRRFYSPCLGRWLNRDPIGEEGGENLYAFCGNNTVAKIDGMGLSCRPGTFNVLEFEIWSVPMVNGLASNPDLFSHGESLLSSIGTLGDLTSLSSLSPSALANFQTFVDTMAGKALSPSGDAMAMLRRLYDELRRGSVVIHGELRYELCVCRGKKAEFVEQDPIRDEESAVDGGDDAEISRIRNAVRNRLVTEMYRRLE